MSDEMNTLPIHDMNEWYAFAAANADALAEMGLWPSEALTKAQQGGIVMGGGAAPATLVIFVD